MYGMTNSGKLFADELTEFLLEAGFILSQCQMSIYYKYAPDGSKIVVLSYVDDCVYLYTNRHNHQHMIRQEFLIHMLHTYNR